MKKAGAGDDNDYAKHGNDDVRVHMESMLHRGARPQDKENHCPRGAPRVYRIRRHADEGRDVGSANYKARLNLRVSLATAAKVRERSGKGNKLILHAHALP